ncbi:hypothetical protein [Oleiagrimonas sp. MCCC 1A03011]|uniref:hypothetical protein n=1 Tax=Oleiagrimonas sp. MCCC 1A03011 TaxID=1926883 RepID=UPI000DC24007|nr:hypothetical protein [Oleiagrimonas sp. MCCC 1A03011]RAP59666.1 hypothetical protein BTJ49_03225 [Oleiagrimonas sp. MCCC 1A03011]
MDLSNPLLIWGCVAFIGGLTLLWMLHTFIIRPHRNSFEDEGIAFELAPDDGLIHISTSRDATPTTLKFGCGAFQFSDVHNHVTYQKWFPGIPGRVSTFTTSTGQTYGDVTPGTEGKYIEVTEARATGTTEVILHELDPIEHYHRKWATHPDTDRTPVARHVTTFTLSNGAARALQRWVNAHSRQLTPSEGDIRMAWEKTCEKQLKTCRKAPQVRALKKPLELYDFDTKPDIRYLAIDKDGAAFFHGCGIAAHEVDFDDLMAQGMTVTVPLPDGRRATLAMKEAQVASLHKIRSRWQKRQRMHG